MRNLFSIVLLASSLSVFAEGFTVFEKDGYYGLKDPSGNVTVPAVYERLGWSDGTTQVHRGVIGYRHKNKWGLITVRNKALTTQKFYSIELLSVGYIKASIKGKYSNHLFYGILDDKGRTIVSFNYFSIAPIGANWLVSDFDGKRQQYGVVSFENELIIPTIYISVSEWGTFFLCKDEGQKINLYSQRGQLLHQGLDSLKYTNGWIAYRDGYAAQLAKDGEVIRDFNNKDFVVANATLEPIPFPEWTVYHHDTIFLKWRCDSLSVNPNNGLLVAYLNGAHHFMINNQWLLSNHEMILKDVADAKLIVQNSKTRKWFILNEKGASMSTAYDTIHTVWDHFGVYDHQGWHLIDHLGKRTNRFAFQALFAGINGQFVAKRNGHWGILTANTHQLTKFKYDSIVVVKGIYLISYLNRWGAMTTDGNWLIRPEFNEIIPFDKILFGRKGRGYTIFCGNRPTYKTTARPMAQKGSFVLIKDEIGKVGLVNELGELSYYPEYDSIHFFEGYWALYNRGQVSLSAPYHETVLEWNEAYQQVGGYAEGYFLVQKEGRWGFVDEQGRLRISNRYELARKYQEGMAPVLIKGKWGFIDKSEVLRVQPYYDEVSPFHSGTSIVKAQQQMGIVDKDGKEVLELIWKSVDRLPTGNYIVQDMENKVGLVSGDGSFILRPSYDYLKDAGDKIVVFANGTWGILDYSGRQLFKINHEEIKVIGDYTMIKN